MVARLAPALVFSLGLVLAGLGVATDAAAGPALVQSGQGGRSGHGVGRHPAVAFARTGFVGGRGAAALLPSRHAPGRSVGSPTSGRLVGGGHLEESAALRVSPAYAAADVRWGLEGLVNLVDRAARMVRMRYPDAVLTVGHMSRPGGGEVDRHVSHESGRDVDIQFYIRGQTGKPLLSDHFVPFRGDGAAVSWPGAFFDDARNWALVAALLSDGRVRITHIFVAAPLRARLLAYAERIGALTSVRVHAAELMAQPHGVLPHDDHFHVRIACPSGMEGCIEYPTLNHGRLLAARAARERHARERATAAATPAPAPGRTRLPPPPPPLPPRVPTTTVSPHGPAPNAPPVRLPPPEPARREAPPPSASPGPPPASVPVPLDDVDGVSESHGDDP